MFFEWEVRLSMNCFHFSSLLLPACLLDLCVHRVPSPKSFLLLRGNSDYKQVCPHLKKLLRLQVSVSVNTQPTVQQCNRLPPELRCRDFVCHANRQGFFFSIREQGCHGLLSWVLWTVKFVNRYRVDGRTAPTVKQNLWITFFLNLAILRDLATLVSSVLPLQASLQDLADLTQCYMQPLHVQGLRPRPVQYLLFFKTWQPCFSVLAFLQPF